MEGCVSVRRRWVNSEKNKEDDWDHNVEEDAIKGPVNCVCREEVLWALNENRKRPWTFSSVIGVDCC